ncbi:MAG: phage holin family protein [Verrucomicrobia bacterium]|nr:phage holin family protein [Verrucomicrobiota bacterium]
MDENESSSGGLFGSVRRLGDAALGMIHRRLELASIELHEEKHRLLDLLLRAAALVVLGILTLVTATALVVVIFWDRSPVATLAIITGLYALATLAVALGIRDKLKHSPPPFAESIDELKKDREWLREKK